MFNRGTDISAREFYGDNGGGGSGKVEQVQGSVIVGETRSVPSIHIHFQFKRTWRLFATLFFVSARSIPSTRRARTSAPSTISFLFASKVATLQKIKQREYLSCKSRNSRFAHRRVRARFPLPLSSLFHLCRPLLVCHFTEVFIHFFFRCHRSACRALWAATRINARMLGSHERPQINRAVSRARPGPL